MHKGDQRGTNDQQQTATGSQWQGGYSPAVGKRAGEQSMVCKGSLRS